VKVSILCSSSSHGNTRKVAEAMAVALGAAVVPTEAFGSLKLDDHDLIGFGSGIRFGRMYPEMLRLADGLPPGASRRAFVFSTSGFGVRFWNRDLVKRLRRKGFDVVGDFACKGLDTMGLLGAFGGVNKGRPSPEDLRAAEAFARSLVAGRQD
jgi:flavodoxin